MWDSLMSICYDDWKQASIVAAASLKSTPTALASSHRQRMKWNEGRNVFTFAPLTKSTTAESRYNIISALAAPKIGKGFPAIVAHVYAAGLRAVLLTHSDITSAAIRKRIQLEINAEAGGQEMMGGRSSGITSTTPHASDALLFTSANVQNEFQRAWI